MQTEYFAMEGLAQLLNTVKLIKSSLNPHLEIEGILLTMYDGRNNLSKLVAKEIKNHFPDDTFKTIIPRNVKLSECPSHGKPIIIYDITSRGSEAYLSLAREIIVKERELQTEQQDLLEQATIANKMNKPEIPSFENYDL
jgi:chromosome partitioning protein